MNTINLQIQREDALLATGILEHIVMEGERNLADGVDSQGRPYIPEGSHLQHFQNDLATIKNWIDQIKNA
jgi:hypothetical protein